MSTSIHTFEYRNGQTSINVIEWHDDGCETYLLDITVDKEEVDSVLAAYPGLQRIHRGPDGRTVSTIPIL